ncbi:DUF2345 domain-containing protein, partial [Stenotrophomonas sp. MMGLT7]|uniref:DUF2345 domain-containing protein n=1 Tax=Stenotrophomonas sp. MMGLT7 TaxID=2901227 RepID=UPI001E3C66ED
APNKHLLATAAGAYIRIEGGNIELGAPGTVEFKASKKELAGAQSASGEVPVFGEAEPKFCEPSAKQADAFGGALVGLG